MHSGYSKRKWNSIYLIICYINMIKFRNINYAGIVPEHYYGTHKMNALLQELKLNGNRYNGPSYFGERLQKVRKDGLPFKLHTIPFNYHEKKKPLL